MEVNIPIFLISIFLTLAWLLLIASDTFRRYRVKIVVLGLCIVFFFVDALVNTVYWWTCGLALSLVILILQHAPSIKRHIRIGVVGRKITSGELDDGRGIARRILARCRDALVGSVSWHRIDGLLSPSRCGIPCTPTP